jgi:hypothetical protein
MWLLMMVSSMEKVCPYSNMAEFRVYAFCPGCYQQFTAQLLETLKLSSRSA